MTTSRIVFDHVWKKFHRGSIHDSLRDLLPALGRKLIGRRTDEGALGDGDFWAVRDLAFEVLPGQCLGIIGPNGSGKSTTLKLLTRILEPTHGRCEMHGRAGTLIEVSAGFHGDLTGRENVFLQGAIMGMRRAEIVRKFDEIVEFSGIDEFIDTPVKLYSSGMNARLGFSIAAHLEPDVLIIDEVLAVGDMSFQDRAFGRIRDLTRSGIPVVIVSHQLDRIAELCTDAILLNRGSAVARGTPNDVIASYVKHAGGISNGTGIVSYDSVQLSTTEVSAGERFTLSVRGRIDQPVADDFEPLRMRVRSLVTGRVAYATAANWLNLDLASPGAFSVDLDFQANLPPGNYVVEVDAGNRNEADAVDAAPGVMLRITSPTRFSGTTSLNPTVRVN
jgi:lipopolysaccharide transport system ATP-binding protein